MGQLRSATEICPGALDPQTYLDCGFAGLGVCWADIYEAGLFGSVDGQWIDITGLADDLRPGLIPGGQLTQTVGPRIAPAPAGLPGRKNAKKPHPAGR